MSDKNLHHKILRELSEPSKHHTERCLKLLAEANHLYRQIKDLPDSPERDRLLTEVLAKDAEAFAEFRTVMEAGRESSIGLHVDVK